MAGPASTRRSTLAAEIRRRTGLNPAKCYQCGKCSAGCPMAEETRLRPHDILRLVQRGRRDRLFADDSIWLCLTCETCSARCPNEVGPARIIDALRELALESGEGAPPRAIRALHESFLKQIRRHGRIFEFGMIAGFKLRSGKLFADVGKMPATMKRGKLALSPRNIAGVGDVRRIFDACAAAAGKEVRP
ncbi:MAG: 4Fe-4S dicluster domain-containing protein [Deltaproteobacteria bacterium]|nr:4Fe-4S dicluster domain-containing protein [Deltaproteobacteria bacterium]